MSEVRQRLPWIDALRGCLLLIMAGYHALWDLAWLFGAMDFSRWETTLSLCQQSGASSFIFLSGFCWPLGRRPLRRGLVVFLWGALIMAVSDLFGPQSTIRFGILTLLGSAMVLLIPLRPLIARVPPAAGCTGALTLFILSRSAAPELRTLAEPFLSGCAPIVQHFAAWLGFPGPDFFSADYFPLIPWIFLYLGGCFFFCAARNTSLMPLLARPAPWFPAVLGRHSLAFYLLHQPVLTALLYLYFLFS